MTFSDKDIYRELINRKPKKAKDLPDPEQHAILGFANADGAVEVYLRNESGESVSFLMTLSCSSTLTAKPPLRFMSPQETHLNADDAVTHIWAGDPGVNTGWAKGISHSDGTLVITGYGYAPWKQVAIWFHDMVNGDSPCDEAVYESWRLTDKGAKVLKGSDMASSQFIGAFKQTIWLAQRSGILIRLAPEQAPERKYVVNGWFGEDYLPKDDAEHARDAIRHLVFRHTVIVGSGNPDPKKISISYLEDKCSV